MRLDGLTRRRRKTTSGVAVRRAAEHFLSTAIERQFTTTTDGFVSLMECLTAFAVDTTTPLVEDGALLAPRQLDKGNSG